MNQTKIIKEMIDLNQTTFNNSFKAAVLFQDQMEKTANGVLDRAIWFPAEGRKAIDQWTKAYKAGRDHLKAYIDESYKNAVALLA
jgi:hypothetical protein